MTARIPITATQHPLQLRELSPLDFERLCFEIVQRLGYQEPEHTGAAGRDMGYDIQAKQGHQVIAVQCKRVLHFTPTQVRKEVSNFLKLPPEQQPSVVVFMTSCAVSKTARNTATATSGDRFHCKFLDSTFLDSFVRRHHDLLERYFIPLAPQSSHTQSAYPCMINPVPFFVNRPEARALRDLLCNPKKDTGAAMVALCGGAGFGKTTLAQWISFDALLRETYPDGVLWARMGRGSGPSGVFMAIADLFRWWTGEDPPAFETLDAAASFLWNRLSGESLLIVLDDVWDETDISPFEGLPPACGVLITTRNMHVLPDATTIIQVGPLGLEESSTVLLNGLPSATPLVRSASLSVAEKLGQWPLGLGLANSQLRQIVNYFDLDLPEALGRMTSRLKRNGIDSLSWHGPRRGRAVRFTISSSIDELTPRDRLLYYRLAVFLPGIEIPFLILQKLWALDLSETEDLCERLFSLSLAAGVSFGSQSIRLHEIFTRYLQELVGDELPSLHTLLLTTVAPRTGRWGDLPETATYLWRFLGHHLMEAGELDTLRKELWTFSYLRKKLTVAGISALLEDLDRIPKDRQTLALRDSLRLSSEVLRTGARDLAPHLLGRLQGVEGHRVSSLLRETRGWHGLPWLRPSTGSFLPPGGPLVRTWSAHKGAVNFLTSLGPDRVASCSLDAVRVWDLGPATANLAADFPLLGAYVVTALSESLLAVGGIGGTLEIWDIASQECTSRLMHPQRAVRSLCPLGSDRLAVGSEDGTIRILHTASALPAQVLPGHLGAVLALALFEDRRLVSGGADGTLRIWNLDNFECEAVLRRHHRAVNCLVARGGMCASASDDKTICIWDLHSGKVTTVLSGHRGAVKAVDLVGDSNILSASSDRMLRLWNPVDGKQKQGLFGHTDWVVSALALDSSRVVSGCRDGTMGLWGLGRRKAARRDLRRHSGWVRTVCPVGRSLLASGSDDRTIRLWRRQTGEALPGVLRHDNWVRSITPVGESSFLSTCDDSVIRLWDTTTGRPIKILQGHSGWVWKVAALNDARLISCASDRNMVLWNLDTGQTTKAFRGSGAWASTLATLDEEHVILGSLDWKLRIRNTETGSLVQVLSGHRAWITQIVVFDNGWIASASLDGTIRLFDSTSGEGLRTIVGHLAGVTGLAAIGNSWLATVSLDRTIRIWDLDTGEADISLTMDHELLSVSYASGQRQHLIVGDIAGRVHFFQIPELRTDRMSDQ